MVLKSLARLQFRESFYTHAHIYIYSGSEWHAITFERFLSRGAIVRFLYQEFRSFLIDQLFRGTPIFRDKPSRCRSSRPLFCVSVRPRIYDEKLIVRSINLINERTRVKVSIDEISVNPRIRVSRTKQNGRFHYSSFVSLFSRFIHICNARIFHDKQ